MRKILITGAGSFVGENVKNWLLKDPDMFSVDVLDMENEEWKSFDFSYYDCVFHVAGIAHVSKNKKTKDLYYKVNYNLAVETALKAKEEGVSQFIFMSSMIIYNGLKRKEKNKGITKGTPIKTRDFYGDSKAKADTAIQALQDKSFNTAIIRPPMIFGKGCKGNFPRLARLAKKLPFFPKIENRRSMLYIENLCEFVKLIIENQSSGVFFPQNPEFFSTCGIIKQINRMSGKKAFFSKIFNIPVYMLYPFSDSLKKLFGNLYYVQEADLSFGLKYQIADNNESIKRSLEV